MYDTIYQHRYIHKHPAHGFQPMAFGGIVTLQETQELLAAVKQKRAGQPNTKDVVTKKEPGVPATVTNEETSSDFSEFMKLIYP